MEEKTRRSTVDKALAVLAVMSEQVAESRPIELTAALKRLERSVQRCPSLKTRYECMRSRRDELEASSCAGKQFRELVGGTPAILEQSSSATSRDSWRKKFRTHGQTGARSRSAALFLLSFLSVWVLWLLVSRGPRREHNGAGHGLPLICQLFSITGMMSIRTCSPSRWVCGVTTPARFGELNSMTTSSSSMCPRTSFR